MIAPTSFTPWGRWLTTLAAGCMLAGAAQALPVLIPADCSSEVTNCAFARDGAFPAEGTAWQTNTAWWQGTGATITVDLGTAQWIGGLTLSVDNNDSYLVQGSVDGVHWGNLLSITAAQGSVGWGMDTFSTVAGSASYETGLSFSAGTARYLRVSAVGGDNMYSVGELQVTAVPEPASVALMLSGLALVGAARRRRAPRD